jgi:SNF2 family DNA or RNA helicase
VRKFQAGELLGVAGTIGAMGVGVTMTRAAQVLFVDLSWTPADNAQARDRAHRHGQERPVNVIRLVASHAIDQRIAQVLAEKIERNDSSVEAASVDENFTAPALSLPAPIVIKAPPTVVPRTIEEETPIDF